MSVDLNGPHSAWLISGLSAAHISREIQPAVPRVAYDDFVRERRAFRQDCLNFLAMLLRDNDRFGTGLVDAIGDVLRCQ